VVEPFVETLGERADLDLSALTPADIQVFRDAELRAGKSNKTANMAVKTLRIGLNAARRQGLLLSNPAEAVENLPEDSAERGAFTPDQIAKMLKVSNNEWRGMILLGACAGLRITDAAHLTWAEVELDRKVIRFSPEKTKGKRKQAKLEIPLLPDLEAYLLKLPAPSHQPHALLFPTLGKKKTTGTLGLSNTFTRLIHQAGIDNEPVSKPTNGKGRTVYRYGFHALRHTFVSLMANAGVSKELRMKLAGHTSNVHDRYTHHELETFRHALANFPRFRQKPRREK
jgi:integrase